MSKNGCVKCLNVMNAIQRRGKVAKGEGGERGGGLFFHSLFCVRDLVMNK